MELNKFKATATRVGKFGMRFGFGVLYSNASDEYHINTKL